jgi:hypothetical protein
MLRMIHFYKFGHIPHLLIWVLAFWSATGARRVWLRIIQGLCYPTREPLVRAARALECPRLVVGSPQFDSVA